MFTTGNQIFGYWTGYFAERFVDWFADKRERLTRPRNLLLTIVVLCALASSFVDAQPAPAPATAPAAGSTYAVAPSDIVPRISAAIDGALGKLSSGALNGMGTTISAFFLIALMVWTSVKTMATGKGFGELIGEWVPVWISYGLVTAFLDKTAANSIVSLMDTIGATIGGVPMTSLSSAIDVVSRPILSAIVTVAEMPMMTEASLFSPSSWAPMLAAGIGTTITKVITVILLLTGAVVGMATVIMSFISVQLVLFLAPVMVPFLMFKPMSWLFDSWLRFLLGACMMKIVLAFMLVATSAILGAMSSLQAQMAAEALNANPSDQMVADLFMHAMMMIFALLSTLLLLQVPSIATGLLSGNAGSTGFGGLRGFTNSAGARGSSAGTSAAGSAVGGAAKVRAAAKIAEFKGGRDASAGKGPDMAYRVGASKAGYSRGYTRNSPPKPTSGTSP